MPHRSLFVVVSLLLFGCASSRTSELVLDATPDARASVLNADMRQPDPAGESIPESTTTSLATPEPEPQPPAVEPAEDGLHGNRFTIKAGYYGSSEDALDDGYIVNLAWTRFLNNLFALELEVGYVDLDGNDAGVDTDVWALPIMLNGRLNLPIWILEAYGGLGIGTFYYDAEASGAISADDDGLLFGGDAFLGASVNVAEAIALGLEAKYYFTDDIEDANTGLDAYALMLTLGWSR